MRLPSRAALAAIAAAGLVLVFSLVAIRLVSAPSYEITGTPTPLYVIEGGTSNPLKAPLGIAYHRNTLYVADSENGRIQVFSANGRWRGELGSGEKGLRFPLAVAVGKGGTLYVADSRPGRLVALSPRGRVLTVFKAPPDASRWQPLALAVDAEGNIWVTEATRGRVFVFDPNGDLIRDFADRNLSYPNGIAFGPGDEVYVADSNNGRLLQYTHNGKLVKELGISGGRIFSLPRGLAVDEKSRLYLADTLAASMYVLSPDGKPLVHFGTPEGRDDGLVFPHGVAIDGKGRIFVSERGANRISVWGYDPEKKPRDET